MSGRPDVAKFVHALIPFNFGSAGNVLTTYKYLDLSIIEDDLLEADILEQFVWGGRTRFIGIQSP